MASSFRAFLVNDLFGDPALYVGLPWARRALLFDLGDISSLSAGHLLKISDVEAGRLAAEAGARSFSLFHLSPTYRDCPGELVAEATGAFAGGAGGAHTGGVP